MRKPVASWHRSSVETRVPQTGTVHVFFEMIPVQRIAIAQGNYAKLQRCTAPRGDCPVYQPSGLAEGGCRNRKGASTPSRRAADGVATDNNKAAVQLASPAGSKMLITSLQRGQSCGRPYFGQRNERNRTVDRESLYRNHAR